MIKKSISKVGVKGAAWTTLSAVGRGVSQLLVLALLSRLLDAADFGVASAALVVINLSLVFAELGVNAAVVQRPVLDSRFLITCQLVTFTFSVVLYGVLAIYSGWFAVLMRLPELREVLPVLGLGFLLRGIAQVSEGRLAREFQFRLLAVIEMFSYVVGYGLVGIFFGYLGYGYWALVAAHLSQSLLQSASLLLLSKPKFDAKPSWSDFRSLLFFGNGVTIGQFSAYGALNGDNFVIARWLGVGALGLYGRAYQLLVMPAALFGQVISKVLFPVLSSIQEDPLRVGSIYLKCVGMVAFIILPVEAFLLVMAPEVVEVLLGDNWNDVIYPFQILVLSLFCRTAYKLSEPVLKSLGKVYVLASCQMIYAILVILGSFLVKEYGINSICYAVSSSVFVYFVALQIACWYYTRFNLREFFMAILLGLVNFTIIAVCALVLASTMRYMEWLDLVVLLVSFLACFGVGIVMIRWCPLEFKNVIYKRLLEKSLAEDKV